MSRNNGSYTAQAFLSENGFSEITEIPMNLIVSGLGAILIEEPLKNADGLILIGNKISLIKVNSNIPYESRKRFTIAHEIGHLLMHKDIDPHLENLNTMNWFNDAEKQLKKGVQEYEANDFAAELLMPSVLFHFEAKKHSFSPNLLKSLAERFKTSITSTAFKYLNSNLNPICIFFINNGKVKYWKKSSDFKVYCKDRTKLNPPEDSVAQEYISAGYEFIYSGEEKAQIIAKSTWFQLSAYEKDKKYFEYCIPFKESKTLISIVWEG
jgi:Zn-dependent peptidase ImmA (M78 family)